MPREFSGTVVAHCRHNYECPWCGCEYEHRFVKRLTEKRWSIEKSLRMAPERARELAEVPKEPIDCPGCGRLPNGKAEPNIFLVAAVPLAVTCFAFLVFSLVFTANSYTVESAWGYSVIVAVLAISIGSFALLARNRESPSGIKRSRRLIRDGEVSVTAPELVETTKRFRRARWTIPFMLVAATAAMAAFPLVALRYSDLAVPENSGVRPQIVGPGEEIKVYMPKRIDSVDGSWNGHPTLRHENPEVVGKPLLLVGKGSNDSWGPKIPDRGKDHSIVPSVICTLPDDAELEGKTIVVNIKMKVKYPKRTGMPGENVDAFENFDHTVRIAVAPKGLVEELVTLWWTATAVAFGCLLAIPLLVLLRISSRKAGIRPPEFEVLEVVPQWKPVWPDLS